MIAVLVHRVKKKRNQTSVISGLHTFFGGQENEEIQIDGSHAAPGVKTLPILGSPKGDTRKTRSS